MEENATYESFRHKTAEAKKKTTKTGRRVWLVFMQQLTILQGRLECKTQFLAASLLGD